MNLKAKFEDPDLQALFDKIEKDLTNSVLCGKTPEQRELAHAEYIGIRTLRTRMRNAVNEDEKKGNSL